MKLKLDQIVSLIINSSETNKRFRISPALKVEANMKKFLNFFFDYYGDKKNITLKNANQYINFSNISNSKMHLWLHSVAYGLRIAMIEESVESTDELTAENIIQFYNKYLPECPIILKSALDKYKFIVINKWDNSQLEYCILKEKKHFAEFNEFPSFVSEQFEKYSVKNEILGNLKELIQVSETLDDAGHFDLSEKILKNTENLANKIGLDRNEKHIK